MARPGYQYSEEQRQPWCLGRASINAPRSKESPGGVTSDDSQVKSIMGRVDLGGRGVRMTGTTRDHQPAQIRGTEDEPQQLVAQRLLACLQYHVP